jgi:hypothetical protein
MTIIKLRTKRHVLHPQLTDVLVLDRARLEMEANWFGVVVKQPGVEHPIIIPWSNVIEVVVDNAEEFMDQVDPAALDHEFALSHNPGAVEPVRPTKKPRAKK